jgi:hypothetical protein
MIPQFWFQGTTKVKIRMAWNKFPIIYATQSSIVALKDTATLPSPEVFESNPNPHILQPLDSF